MRVAARPAAAGGRNELYGNAQDSLADSWVYRADTSSWEPMRIEHLPHADSVPIGRWGHGMACGLQHTGPPHATPYGVGLVECVLFGGSQVADTDFLDDTWLLRVATDAHGAANGSATRRYFWERQNSRVAPHGRWCFAMAACGSRVVMMGGSTDFRVSADETWVWRPETRRIEDPTHTPGWVGAWERVYGTDPFDDMEGGRPAGAGPLRLAGFGLAHAGAPGASDILLLCAPPRLHATTPPRHHVLPPLRGPHAMPSAGFCTPRVSRGPSLSLDAPNVRACAQWRRCLLYTSPSPRDS